MSYEKFSRFYDLVMGDRSEAARYLAELIAHRKPDAKSVLEIACGTGSILGILSEEYEVTGVDRCKPMLAIARKRLPHVQFFRQEMTNFRLPRRFDVIICVFDSMNHLLRFTDWQRTFRRVARHLNNGGLFIFDVNPIGKLRRLAEGPAWQRWFDRDLVTIKVTGGQRAKFVWDVKIFEHEKSNRYGLIQERIYEVAFPMKRILSSVRVHFSTVNVLDPFRGKPSDRSERLYFVCKAR
jgi:SAM-dependent methyltransferase